MMVTKTASDRKEGDRLLYRFATKPLSRRLVYP